MPVILLRNLCLNDGLANGTKFLMYSTQRTMLTVEVLTGPVKGLIKMLPQMTLIHEPDMESASAFSRP
ncbi:hypothetical protein H4Q26_003812 [Puccinia striiformis f. sp. tritici PST-130]|nr:hypothetical protein H4Q26_003812 [Puccinia striiformis f. sp. tritici PST-130]